MARPAPASVRATDIISFLTAHPSRAFTISELVRHLGMNIASAHATLAVLCDCGFLIRDPVHRTYVLGPAFAVTGFAALEQHPAIEAAIEQAEVLAAELNAEVGVTAIAGRDVIFLARRGPDIGTARACTALSPMPTAVSLTRYAAGGSVSPCQRSPHPP